MDSELRILVLDDEPPIRKGICTLITHKLPSVHIVGQGSNGLEGLELYRSTLTQSHYHRHCDAGDDRP